MSSSTKSEMPPSFPNVLPANQLEDELMRWYHEVIWAHNQRLKAGFCYESLKEYITRTYQKEHFNIFLLGLTLEDREVAFIFRQSIFYDIRRAIVLGPAPFLEGPTREQLLDHYEMSLTVFHRLAAIHDNIAPGPQLSMIERLLGVPKPLATKVATPIVQASVADNRNSGSDTKDQLESSPEAQKTSFALRFNRTEANKLVAELMRAFTARAEWRTQAFEEQIKMDKESFRVGHIAETNRHAAMMNELIRERKKKLRDHEATRVNERYHNEIIYQALNNLMDEVATVAG
ncbi:hypothetical protein PCANC_10261 [Puccinia coronata f. sp. avenae]|uniref:Uncharacterized protein n=1 Tax=Puccinia coronata f. sp. avenae TaxID=200324 RepID=A0A2N5VQ81_9BASI|nr:hypothetical protein PCANC_10261 [Puccinia coronata f. sp. avenae]